MKSTAKTSFKNHTNELDANFLLEIPSKAKALNFSSSKGCYSLPCLFLYLNNTVNVKIESDIFIIKINNTVNTVD